MFHLLLIAEGGVCFTKKLFSTCSHESENMPVKSSFLEKLKARDRRNPQQE